MQQVHLSARNRIAEVVVASAARIDQRTGLSTWSYQGDLQIAPPRMRNDQVHTLQLHIHTQAGAHCCNSELGC